MPAWKGPLLRYTLQTIWMEWWQSLPDIAQNQACCATRDTHPSQVSKDSCILLPQAGAVEPIRKLPSL